MNGWQMDAQAEREFKDRIERVPDWDDWVQAQQLRERGRQLQRLARSLDACADLLQQLVDALEPLAEPRPREDT